MSDASQGLRGSFGLGPYCVQMVSLTASMVAPTIGFHWTCEVPVGPAGGMDWLVFQQSRLPVAEL